MMSRRTSKKNDYADVKISDYVDEKGEIKTPEDENVLAYLKTLEDKFESSEASRLSTSQKWPGRRL